MSARPSAALKNCSAASCTTSSIDSPLSTSLWPSTRAVKSTWSSVTRSAPGLVVVGAGRGPDQVCASLPSVHGEDQVRLRAELLDEGRGHVMRGAVGGVSGRAISKSVGRNPKTTSRVIPRRGELAGSGSENPPKWA